MGVDVGGGWVAVGEGRGVAVGADVSVGAVVCVGDGSTFVSVCVGSGGKLVGDTGISAAAWQATKTSAKRAIMVGILSFIGYLLRFSKNLPLNHMVEKII